LAPPESPGAGQRAVPARAIEPSTRAAVWSPSAPAGAARWVERRPRVAGECPSNVPVSLSCGQRGPGACPFPVRTPAGVALALDRAPSPSRADRARAPCRRRRSLAPLPQAVPPVPDPPGGTALGALDRAPSLVVGDRKPSTVLCGVDPGPYRARSLSRATSQTAASQSTRTKRSARHRQKRRREAGDALTPPGFVLLLKANAGRKETGNSGASGQLKRTSAPDFCRAHCIEKIRSP
jgi:hypothetical protein